MKQVIAKFLPQNFNDLLSLVLTGATVLLWLMNGRGLVKLDDKILGATIVTWTLLVQHYFRKRLDTK